VKPDSSACFNINLYSCAILFVQSLFRSTAGPYSGSTFSHLANQRFLTHVSKCLGYPSHHCPMV
jgi:hypothetical protein